jgi:hypothetical protein
MHLGDRASIAASCRGRGLTMDPQGGACLGLPVWKWPRVSWYLHNARQWWPLCWRTLPRRGKWLGRIESGGPRPLRILHSKDPFPRPPGGTCEGPECCLSIPETQERIPLAHCEPVTLVTPPDVELPQVRDILLSCRMWLQQPGQIWVTLNPNS